MNFIYQAIKALSCTYTGIERTIFYELSSVFLIARNIFISLGYHSYILYNVTLLSFKTMFEHAKGRIICKINHHLFLLLHGVVVENAFTVNISVMVLKCLYMK